MEKIDGRLSLRYAIADRMTSQGCVDCHNTHLLSPRRDFKLNDVMGGVVITIPLDR